MIYTYLLLNSGQLAMSKHFSIKNENDKKILKNLYSTPRQNQFFLFLFPNKRMYKHLMVKVFFFFYIQFQDKFIIGIIIFKSLHIL